MPCTSTTFLESVLGVRTKTTSGFTLVSALFILVVLAALGAALAKISQRQHLGSAAEIDAARAYQSARAGIEWGAFQVLRNPAPPAAAPACFGTTSFQPPGSIAGFTVTVSCARTPGTGSVSDGSTALVFYRLAANACSAPTSGSCPASGAPGVTYAERQLTSTVMR
jgi:MSHA biogenesis protein MshP